MNEITVEQKVNEQGRGGCDLCHEGFLPGDTMFTVERPSDGMVLVVCANCQTDAKLHLAR